MVVTGRSLFAVQAPSWTHKRIAAALTAKDTGRARGGVREYAKDDGGVIVKIVPFDEWLPGSAFFKAIFGTFVPLVEPGPVGGLKSLALRTEARARVRVRRRTRRMHQESGPSWLADRRG